MHGQSSQNTVIHRSLALQDIPSELLKDVVALLDTHTLLEVQQVSSLFHRLASEVIYQDLDFKITCSSAEANGDAGSRAADALQTVNTSEYNYAYHIKSFRLGYNDINIGHVADPTSQMRTVFDSSADASKLLNTSILQMVRQAQILESFTWDLPVELSGYVYRALQKVKSLVHLHIRLDGGPATKRVSRSSAQLNYYPPAPLLDPPLPNDLASGGFVRNASFKRRKGPPSTFWLDKRVFSGFTGLQTLELTQLMNLEGLSELRQCIKACSSTLRNLTLTVNSSFGSKAQRSSLPPPPDEYDSLSETEPEDEYLDVTNLHVPANDEVDRRQEKMALEGLLANIFDLQSTAVQAQKLERKMGLPGGKCLIESDRTNTLHQLESAFNAMQEINLSRQGSTQLSNLRIAKVKAVKELAERYISQHSSKVSRHPKSNAKPIGKKALKPSKYLPPTYPQPGLMATDAFESFNFEEFLDANGPPSSPGSFDLPTSSSNIKAWPSSKSKFPNNDPIYIEEPLPHLYPPSKGMNPTLDPSSMSLGANLSLPHPDGPSPFSMTVGSSKNIKLDPGGDLTYLPYEPPAQPYSIPMSSNIGGKASKTKYKPYAKYSLKPPGSGSTLYGGASASKKKNTSIANNGGFIGIKAAKSGAKPKSFPHEKYGNASSSSSSSTVSDNESEISSVTETPTGTVMFPAAEVNGNHLDDETDVDMEHPDSDEADLDDDQDLMSDASSEELGLYQNGQTTASTARSEGPGQAVNGQAESGEINGEPTGEAADNMHDYIRMTHGIQLEVLRLQFVPLKASILARALDLRAMQHLTLLETGPQDAFWALLVKLTDTEAPINFKSIHTDHVSMALLKYLSSYAGLENLFLHERRAKKKESDSGIDVDIASLRKQAIRPHVHSLQRLMLRNERNDCWDLDLKTIHLLATQAKDLRELAIGVKIAIYHGLLQILPAFRSLEVLHLISLRGGDRNNFLQGESLSFTMDSLVQCTDLRLRYIAVVERVNELAGQSKYRQQLRDVIDGAGATGSQSSTDRKGKGKAVEHDEAPLAIASDVESDSRFTALHAAQKDLRKQCRFDDVGHIKIFSSEIRTGRL